MKKGKAFVGKIVATFYYDSEGQVFVEDENGFPLDPEEARAAGQALLKYAQNTDHQSYEEESRLALFLRFMRSADYSSNKVIRMMGLVGSFCTNTME